jgi:hypothetical protein
MSYEFKGRTRDRVEAESDGRSRRRREPRPASGGSLTHGEERQPIHAFAATMGLAFLLAGIAGFIPGLTTNYDQLELAGPESGAELFGLFRVSILHNIVHLLFAVGLLAAARAAWSRAYLLGGGIGYLGVVLYGVVVDHDSDANFLPLNDADNLLHLGLALSMIVLGIVDSRLSRAGT